MPRKTKGRKATGPKKNGGVRESCTPMRAETTEPKTPEGQEETRGAVKKEMRVDETTFYPSVEDAEEVKRARREALRRSLRNKIGLKAARTGRVKFNTGNSKKSSVVKDPDGNDVDLDSLESSLGGQSSQVMNMLESMRRFGVKETLDSYGCTWEKFRSMSGTMKGPGGKAARNKMKKMTGVDMGSVMEEAKAKVDKKKEKRRRRRKRKAQKEKDAAAAEAEGEATEEEEDPKGNEREDGFVVAKAAPAPVLEEGVKEARMPDLDSFLDP